jgi:type IV pilus assembly protein PilM
MALFGGKKSDSYLGVDIGASGLKVVELSSNKGRATLMTYGYSERDIEKMTVSPLEDTKATGKLLARVCKEAGCEAKKAMTALPSSNVFSTIVSVPAKKKKEDMQPQIDRQVGKLTPLPLSEMVTYSTFIDDPEQAVKEKAEPDEGRPGRKKSHVRVLVTGASKSLVQKYVEIFNYADLELEAVDTESFALIRSLIGKDKSPIMLVDIGASRTNIVVVEMGIPFLSRSINVGGNMITKRIMNQMNIERKQAERTKQDFGTLMGDDAETAVGGMPKVFEPAMNSIVQEIEYGLELYAKMDKTIQTSVEKIIVTGGTSHIPHVPDYFAESLNMNVYRGDPWARVVHPKQLSPVLNEIGPRMSVSIGLAMRDIE